MTWAQANLGATGVLFKPVAIFVRLEQQRPWERRAIN